MSRTVDLIKEVPEIESLIEKVNISGIEAIKYVIYLMQEATGKYDSTSLQRIFLFQEFFIHLFLRVGLFLADNTHDANSGERMTPIVALEKMVKKAVERLNQINNEEKTNGN